MEAVWAYVGPSRAQVEPCCAHLRLMLRQVGPMFCHRAHLRPILAQVGPMLAMLGSSWAHVGPMLAYVGPMLAHVETSWELCWGHVWAIYVEPILRCQFLRPGPPPGAQIHVKTEVLQHGQNEIPCRRRARNTVKNRCFLTPQEKYTVGFQPPCMTAIGTRRKNINCRFSCLDFLGTCCVLKSSGKIPNLQFEDNEICSDFGMPYFQWLYIRQLSDMGLLHFQSTCS